MLKCFKYSVNALNDKYINTLTIQLKDLDSGEVAELWRGGVTIGWM